MAAKSRNPSPSAAAFVVVAGSDEGMVRGKAAEFYQQLTGGTNDGFTHETIDGVADSSDAAYQACALTIQALLTIPMFGGDKVVWLRNVNFLSDTITGRSQRTESGVEELRATLERGLPPGVRFLMSAHGVDKRRAFWKFVEKHAELLVCDRIDTSRDDWHEQVAAYVTRQAEALGLRFEADAMELFVMQAGEQSQQIGNELEKLDIYLGPHRRTVTQEDVNTMVPLSREAIIFETGRALQSGHAARAIELVDQQLAADEKCAIAIMRASIITTVRNLYQAKLVASQFKPPTHSFPAYAAAVNRAPEHDRSWLPKKKDGSGVSVYPAFLASGPANHFDLADLQHLLEAALRADQALVTTSLDHRLILHRLIVQIAAARKPRTR